MPQFRELLKRSIPSSMREAVKAARARLAPPPLEDIVLHDYAVTLDSATAPRLTLVIPSISPANAFGGILTGLDLFLEIGKRTGAELRIVIDDFERDHEYSVVEKRAAALGMGAVSIDFLPRTTRTPVLPLRSSDVFFSFNWWTTLNIRPVLQEQCRLFSVPKRPQLYAIQDYEPFFFPFSSTLMMAQLAYEPRWPCWGMFNTAELYEFFLAQGHTVDRAFVFEPQLSATLRPFLEGPAPIKARRILVYGRPSIPRNCFPAIEKGLQLWAARYPEFAGWEVVSAGIPHTPRRIAADRSLQSLGKLSLGDYGELLRSTAVGLSLMCSPHPSYPPLEMAHFGLRTITNRFANKDLSASHDNIISVADIAPETLAEALGQACSAFEADPGRGWSAQSRRPSFLAGGAFSFLDEISRRLVEEVWSARATDAPVARAAPFAP